MSETTWFLVIFSVAFLLGLRGSWRLTRRYRDVRDQLIDRERLILLSIVVVSWVITVAAGYFGVLSVRTIAGFERIPQLVPVSVLISSGVLFIPAFLDAVVDRVARVPWS